MEFKITKHNSIQYGYKNHAYEIYKPKVGNQNYSALKKLFLSCESALANYSKVCVIRADLHPAKYSSDNKLIHQFLKLQVQKFEKRYKCNVRYFCAREQMSSDKEHYHLALFFSGHKVNYPQKVLLEVQQAWNTFCQGSVKLVKSPFYMMNRGDVNEHAYRSISCSP